jgi:hypothetical protein
MDRAPEGEQLTRKQVEHNIKRIDKNRAKTREIMGQGRWNDCDNILTISRKDVTDIEIVKE